MRIQSSKVNTFAAADAGAAGHPDQAPDERGAACEALTRALQSIPGGPGAQEAQGAAQEILGCVSPRLLDFGRLGERLAQLVCSMPPEGWDALRDHALATTGRDIVRVSLTGTMLDDRTGPGTRGLSRPLAEGLGRLAQLWHLGVDASIGAGQVLDLGALRHPPGQKLVIDLRPDYPSERPTRSEPFTVRAPAGAKVLLEGETGPLDARVVPVDTHGGEVGAAHPLVGRVDAQKQATAALVAALDTLTLPAGDTARSVAKALLKCVKGTAVDFADLPNAYAKLVERLPAEGWDALNQYVQARADADISHLAMHQHLAYLYGQTGSGSGLLAPFVAGLCRLPGLEALMVPAAYESGAEIDLSGLSAARTRPPAIEVAEPFELPFQVRVPQGTQVCAAAGARSPHRCDVIHVDAGGNPVGAPRKLERLIYDSTRARAPRGVDLNPQYPRYACNAPRRPMVCRDLALQWPGDREQHRRSGGAAFDYRPYATEPAISRNVRWDTTLDSLRLRRTPAHALFDHRQFGSLIADEFRSMAVGETRQFVIDTAFHLMPFEMRVKQAPGEPVQYVLNFYDNNFPALHERVTVSDPQMLRGMQLVDWVGALALNTYFGAEGKFAALCRWPVDEAAPPRQARSPQEVERLLAHVPQHARLTSDFLFWALHEGLEEQVSACMDAMLPAPGRTLDWGEFSGLQALSETQNRTPGLRSALINGSTGTVDRYVRFILEAPRVTPAQKMQLLDVKLIGAFTLLAPVEGISGYVRLIAQVPDDSTEFSLSPAQRREVLMSRSGGTQRPLLHEIASLQSFSITHPGLASGQHELVFNYLREIVASNLPMQDKLALCASAHGMQGAAGEATTAAQAAMANGNPRAAAAMIAAILGAEPDTVRRDALLESLGVRVEDVLAALARTGARADALWTSQLHELISRSPLPGMAGHEAEAAEGRLRTASQLSADQLEAELARVMPASWGTTGQLGMIAAEMTDAFLDCVQGSSLDFTRFTSEPPLELLSRLTPEGWDALQAHVVATTGRGIGDVVLHDGAAFLYRPADAADKPMASLVAGLSRLPGLARLSVPRPYAADDAIDLLALRPARGQPLTVEVRDDDDEDTDDDEGDRRTDVRVPPDVKVRFVEADPPVWQRV